MPDTPDPLDATRRLWTIGRYAEVGDLFAAAGEDVVSRVGVEGLDVLDVACGTGNTTLAAARAGARRVVGVDLTPALLAEAADRATAAGLDGVVEWREADMAELPVPDAGFDRVVSTFGAMFARDQQRVAAELQRACRPGGAVAVTAWAIDSLFDRMTATFMGFLPEPPPPGPSPRDWARPELLPGIFGVDPGAIAVEERGVEWAAGSAEAAIALMEESSGPVMTTRAGLGDAWPAARAAVVELFEELDTTAGAGPFTLELRYTIATLRRA